MFLVHASSILHGGLVGAGFTWATITMVFTILILIVFLGDTNGQIHCWKGKGTRRDRGTAVFTIFHSSSDMKSPRLNFTLAYSWLQCIAYRNVSVPLSMCSNCKGSLAWAARHSWIMVHVVTHGMTKKAKF